MSFLEEYNQCWQSDTNAYFTKEQLDRLNELSQKQAIKRGIVNGRDIMPVQPLLGTIVDLVRYRKFQEEPKLNWQKEGF